MDLPTQKVARHNNHSMHQSNKMTHPTENEANVNEESPTYLEDKGTISVEVVHCCVNVTMDTIEREVHPTEDNVNPVNVDFIKGSRHLIGKGKQSRILTNDEQNLVNPAMNLVHPTHGIGHPTHGIVHPTHGIVHSTHDIVHSTQDNGYPSEDNVHPTQDNRYPTQDSVHPIQGNVHPTQDNVHPNQDNINAVKDNMHSAQDNMQPTQDNVHPIQDEIDTVDRTKDSMKLPKDYANPSMDKATGTKQSTDDMLNDTYDAMMDFDTYRSKRRSSDPSPICAEIGRTLGALGTQYEHRRRRASSVGTCCGGLGAQGQEQGVTTWMRGLLEVGASLVNSLGLV